MKLETKTSRNGRYAILVDGVVQFETYSITRDQWTRLNNLIMDIRDAAFEEGKKCQQALESIDATNASRRPRAEDQPLQSASIPPGNHCVLAENLSIGPAGAADDE